jgi:hypothetical protein
MGYIRVSWLSATLAAALVAAMFVVLTRLGNDPHVKISGKTGIRIPHDASILEQVGGRSSYTVVVAMTPRQAQEVFYQPAVLELAPLGQASWQDWGSQLRQTRPAEARTWVGREGPTREGKTTVVSVFDDPARTLMYLHWAKR